MERDEPARPAFNARMLLQGDSGRYVLLLLALGLVVRFVPAYLIYGSNDVGAWRLVIREFAMHHNPYLTKKLNWPPLWPTLLLYTARMQEVYSLPDYVAVKVIPILVDASVPIALYWWFARNQCDLKSAFRRALWYALNPVAIFTCAFHGQFDGIPAFFSLLAVMPLLAARPSSADTIHSAFWLNLGIMARTWPVVLLPILLTHIRSAQRKAAYLLLALVPTIACLYLLYLQAPRAVVENVLLYRGGAGGWGLTAPAVFLSDATATKLAGVVRVILYLAWIALYVVVWRRRLPLAPAALLGVLTFYVFSPDGGVQHFEWIVPLAVLVDFRRMRLYTLVAGACIGIMYIFSPYNGEHFGFLKRTRSDLFWQTNMGHHHLVIGMWNFLPLWLLCVWWYITLLRDTLAQPRSDDAAPAS
jgi:hypothetical protein